MPAIKPFRAIFYDPDRVELGNVLASAFRPPEKNEFQAMVQKEEHSCLRLTTGFESGWYADAARLYRAWRNEGILEQDNRDALYVLRQTVRVSGRMVTRQGFFALCALLDAEGHELPSYYQSSLHQRDDQYRLLDASGAFFEPVICGYRDEKHSLESLLTLSAQENPWLQCSWNGGTCSVWRVTSEAPIAHAMHFFAHADVAILEGRHVYDAALRHAQRPEYAQHTDGGSAVSVPVFFCNTADGVTSSAPVHRSLEPVQPVAREEVLARLHKHFVLQQLNREQGMESLQRDGRHGILIAWPGIPTFTYARLKNPDLLETLIPAGTDEPARSFDVSLLHRHVLEGVFEIPFDRQLYSESILFTPEAQAILARVRSRNAIGFFLHPPSVDLLMEAAKNGPALPYQAAVLQPALPAGLVMYAIS